jgi:hypothetical protein
MISIRSNLGNYLIGAIIILSGLFMLILPSFLLTAGADGPPPPPASILLGIGAIFGVPLMTTGVILTQNLNILDGYIKHPAVERITAARRHPVR